MRVFVETGAGLHRHGAAGAWTFDLPYWGLVGLGNDEVSALVALEVATGHPVETLTVVERVHGNELAFARDREPARRLPDWAQWHTAHQLAWHIADVESRYYLTGLGLPARPRTTEVVTRVTRVARTRASHSEGSPS